MQSTVCGMFSHWNWLYRVVRSLEAYIVAGIRVELSEEIPEYERLHVSGANDDVFERFGIANRVVQSSLQLREDKNKELKALKHLSGVCKVLDRFSDR